MLNMTDQNWKVLLGRIKNGRCTPILGAGSSSGVFPLGSDIARDWTNEYKYPMADSYDLARVAQYVAVTVDPMEPKDRIQQQFQAVSLPDLTSHDEPHCLLADLPFPIFITTNYDNLMISALQHQFISVLNRHKNPKLELCRWNSVVRKNVQSIFDKDKDYTPTAADPLVFHFHGHYETPESMVLTEDDYLDFLINISKDEDLLPPCIQKAMTGSSLLFLGYKIADWDFRVLFRSIVGYLEKSLTRLHISVQIAPDLEGITTEQRENVQKYLEAYYAKLEVRVYWGSFSEFTTELRRRWVEYNHGN